MKYFQVKSNYDKLYFYEKKGNRSFLIGHELYTENEYKKLECSIAYFNEIYISKFNTYKFSGARFIQLKYR